MIGSGSSAIQIVPAIQKSVKHLDNYVRGKTWIATPFAATYVNSRGSEANCKSHLCRTEFKAELRMDKFTDDEIDAFKTDHKAYRAFQKGAE